VWSAGFEKGFLLADVLQDFGNDLLGLTEIVPILRAVSLLELAEDFLKAGGNLWTLAAPELATGFPCPVASSSSPPLPRAGWVLALARNFERRPHVVAVVDQQADVGTMLGKLHIALERPVGRATGRGEVLQQRIKVP